MNEYTSRKTALQTPQNRKLPNFYEKVTEFLQESYRISPRKLPNFLKRINQGLHRLCIFITSELYKYAKQVIMP